MSLETLCYVAAALSGLTTVAVVVISVVCIVLILRSGNKHLEKITESLPKVVEVLEQSHIPPQVLIALCDEANVTINELLEIYRKDAMEREAVVERTFGLKDSTTKRFLRSDPQFIKEGYAGESAFTKYAFGGQQDKN